jgi:hypothetical protein
MAHPTGKTEVVLQITSGGGFVPIEYDYTNIPEFSLYGDGRVVVSGPVMMVYPGPALPNLQTTMIPEKAVQAILSGAGDTGLFDSTFDYGQPGIADAPTTTFVVNAQGQTHRVAVYALGMESGASGLSPKQQQIRAALSALRGALIDLTTFVQGEIAWTQFEYRALAVYSRAVSPNPSTDSTDIMANRLDWPLGDLGTLGEEVAGGFRRVVVSGQDLSTLQQKPPLSEATVITLWKSGSREYQLLFRPLLPDEIR